MSMEIRLGTKSDTDQVAKLYGDINEHLASTTNFPGWKKDVYPVRQDAVNGIAEGCLFIALKMGEVVGSMILRHKPEPAYCTAAWQAALEDRQVLVLYTFAVSPQMQNCGIGSQMLEFAEQYAKNAGMKALRLDVYEKNLPAIRLYEKRGYQYIETVSLGMECYGLDYFRLYEKLL